MLSILEVVAAASYGAVLSTIPVGPINLWLIALCFAGCYRIWWAAIAGVIVADALVAVLSYILVKQLSLI